MLSQNQVSQKNTPCPPPPPPLNGTVYESQIVSNIMHNCSSSRSPTTKSPGLSAAAERRRRRVILPRRTPPIHPGVHRRTACIF